MDKVTKDTLHRDVEVLKKLRDVTRKVKDLEELWYRNLLEQKRILSEIVEAGR